MKLFFTFFVAYCATLMRSVVPTSIRVDVSQAPYIPNEHDVQFFILETSFPYNAPDQIKDTAGDIFRKFYVTHAGLGVWDTTSDYKFSIEFVSTDYAGSLLPDFSDASIVWGNAGQVTFTTPTDDSDWLNSQLICTATGVTYNQLITYIQGNMNSFEYFQPVEVMWHNASNHFNSETYSDRDIIISKRDSFWFVNQLIDQLSSYGASVQAYLTTYATAFQYITSSDSAPAVVTWVQGGPTNPDVYTWYRNLSLCYQAQYDDVKGEALGGQVFLDVSDGILHQLVKKCYGTYAYVYQTDYSVYNVTLANFSVVDSTPKLARYAFYLSEDGTGDELNLQPIDYILIAVVALGLLVGIYLLMKRVCRKPRRSAISLEGDKVAERTVAKLAAAKADDDSINQEESYYRTKSADRPAHALLSFSSRGIISASDHSSDQIPTVKRVRHGNAFPFNIARMFTRSSSTTATAAHESYRNENTSKCSELVSSATTSGLTSTVSSHSTDERV